MRNCSMWGLSGLVFLKWGRAPTSPKVEPRHNEKGDSHEIPTFRQLRTPGFGGSTRHNDLRRRMGLGFGQGRSAQGVRRLSRGGGEFHRHRQLLHKRDERIVSRRVYEGPSPEHGASHEIL